MISVIMSTYNESLIDLEISINSILNQTFEAFEFIIVQDNPDNLPINNYLLEKAQKDNRIKIVHNQTNLGLAKSLNIGLQESKYQIIARMDADDEAFPERLKLQYDTLLSQRVDLVFTQCNIVDENRALIKKTRSYPFGENLISALKYKNIISHPSVMFKKSAVMDLGGYSTIPVVEDYDLWLRMIAKGCSFYPINKVLMNCQVRSIGMTKSNYYRTYIADRLIKKTYKNQYSNQITKEEYEEFYSKNNKRDYSTRFNLYTTEFLDCIARPTFLNISKSMVLLARHHPLRVITWNNLNSIRHRK